jgi:hypothetical protein
MKLHIRPGRLAALMLIPAIALDALLICGAAYVLYGMGNRISTHRVEGRTCQSYTTPALDGAFYLVIRCDKDDE